MKCYERMYITLRILLTLILVLLAACSCNKETVTYYVIHPDNRDKAEEFYKETMAALKESDDKDRIVLARNATDTVFAEPFVRYVDKDTNTIIVRRVSTGVTLIDTSEEGKE